MGLHDQFALIPGDGLRFRPSPRFVGYFEPLNPLSIVGAYHLFPEHFLIMKNQINHDSARDDQIHKYECWTNHALGYHVGHSDITVEDTNQQEKKRTGAS